MDAGYFRSTPFLVALLVALGIMGTGVALYAIVGGGEEWSVGSDAGCDAPALAGAPVEVAPTDAKSDATHRTVSWTLDANGTQGGLLRACVDAGSVAAVESPDGAIHVVARIVGRAEAVDATQVSAAFAKRGAGIQIAAWEARAGRAGGFGFARHADVAFEIQLPSTGRFDADASTDSGAVTLRGLLWGNLSLSADSGDVTLESADLAGNATLLVDSGTVRAQLSGVGPGAIRAGADSGTIRLTLPQRADVGYDVTGSAASGDVSVSIGETERYEKQDDDVRAVSKDYASKPTQVRVNASVDSGIVEVVATP